jgi:hypothetical protein
LLKFSSIVIGVAGFDGFETESSNIGFRRSLLPAITIGKFPSIGRPEDWNENTDGRRVDDFTDIHARGPQNSTYRV